MSGNVDLDTTAATADLLAAVAEWQAVISSVDGTVRLSVDREGATGPDTNDLPDRPERLAMQEWEALASRGISIEVHLDTSGADSELVAALAAWNTGLAQGVSGAVDLDTAGATDNLVEALLVWQQAVNLSGTVKLNTESASADLAATVAAWKAVLDDIHVTIKVSTEGAGIDDLLLQVGQWQALVADGITVSVDMDTTEASARLGVAVDEWDIVLRQGLSTGVDMDTGVATEQLGVAVDEWTLILDQKLGATVDLDTEEATTQLRTAVAEWRAITAPKLDVDVDMDTAAATADLTRAFAAHHDAEGGVRLPARAWLVTARR